MKTIIRIAGQISAANRYFHSRVNLVGVVLIFILMWMIMVDVLGRSLLNSPLQGTYEIGTSMIVVIVFFSLAYTQRIGANIRVESVLRILPTRVRSGVELFGLLVALFFFICVTYSSGQEAWSSWLKKESYLTLFYGDILLPIYPAKVAVPFGAALMSLQLLSEFIGRLAQGLGSSREEKQ